MILKNFRKKPSNLKLVRGRKTSYQFYPEIKKRNQSSSTILKLNFKKNFEVVNNFKWKSCKQQSFITFQDLQLLFDHFSIQGRLKND
jgi:hypothetical protein